MYIIIDRTTNKIIQTLEPSGYVPDLELETGKEMQEIRDDILINKIKTAYDYTLIFNDNGTVADINVMKTVEQYQAEQPVLPQPPTAEERLASIEDLLITLI